MAPTKKKTTKPTPKKMGRPRKNAAGLNVAVFTRVTEALGAEIEALAVKYRVTPSDVLRWLIEDAIKSKWRPSHLVSDE